MVIISTKKINKPFGFDKKAFKKGIEKMLLKTKKTDAELSILITNDSEIEKLNKTYRKKSMPTDVLSFPMNEGQKFPQNNIELLGDIVISLDTAKEQSYRENRKLLYQLFFLSAHGLLHLLGYDHRNDKEEKTMNTKTDELYNIAITK